MLVDIYLNKLVIVNKLKLFFCLFFKIIKIKKLYIIWVIYIKSVNMLLYSLICLFFKKKFLMKKINFIFAFAFNLIDNLIKLILAIVLSLVYWSLYKIIKEYPWSNHNKTEGFLLAIANKKIIAQTQVFIVLIVVVNKKNLIRLK